MFHLLASQHPAYTHTYSSIYFPPLFRFTGIILPSHWWSTPLSSCHTIQFKTIVSYPLCARHWAYSHPFSESSWSGVILDSTQYLTQKFDHKIPSILPLKISPPISQICLLTVLPWFWPSSFLTQENAAVWHAFWPPSAIRFHTKALIDLLMNSCKDRQWLHIIYRKQPQL